MAISSHAQEIYDFDHIFNEDESDLFLPSTPCAHCGKGHAFWSDNLEPLFVLQCELYAMLKTWHLLTSAFQTYRGLPLDSGPKLYERDFPMFRR